MKPLLFGLLTGALILLLCISGCTTQPGAPQTTAATTQPTATPVQTTTISSETGTQQGLAGVAWYLVAFNSGTSGSLNVLPETEITAFFDGNGAVSGSAGCNRYTASYSGTLNGLAIGTPATTRMICDTPSGIMTQETYYLTTVQSASTFKIEGDILTIMEGNGNAILTFTKVVPGSQPSAPLTGGAWHLTAYIDVKGEIFTPLSGTTLTVQFDEGGDVTGSAGCNNFFGTYTIPDDGRISIGPLASTLMACPGDGVMDQETMYLQLLQNMNIYYISGDELILSGETGKATLIFDLRK
ncbi:MAG TPA: META domain-containing protein [Methanoregulaceae archaeon]|nr:META domain-containing protein [Methanoregulaceae archaeon]